MSPFSGRLIVLEGINGAGKSTQARRLGAAIQKAGMTTITQVRNPPATWLGGMVRHYFSESANIEAVTGEAEVLLLASSTRDLVTRAIIPALTNGHCVVCERYTLSSLAYQGALGVPFDFIHRTSELASAGIEPDLTILLDIEASLAMQRVSQGSDLDRMERRGAPYLARVRELYHEYLPRSGGVTATVNAAAPLDSVAVAVWRAVGNAFSATET